MKGIDLKDLVSGLLVVIFAAMALGKYDALAKWAKREALVGTSREVTQPFFPH